MCNLGVCLISKHTTFGPVFDPDAFNRVLLYIIESANIIFTIDKSGPLNHGSKAFDPVIDEIASLLMDHAYLTPR